MPFKPRAARVDVQLPSVYSVPPRSEFFLSHLDEKSVYSNIASLKSCERMNAKSTVNIKHEICSSRSCLQKENPAVS